VVEIVYDQTKKGLSRTLPAFDGVVLIMSARLTQAVATAPSLGTAASFAVLGGSTVTNTGPTLVTGDLGVSPGSAIVGFFPSTPGGPGTVVGTQHAADAVAAQAQADAATAYTALAGQACDFTHPLIADTAPDAGAGRPLFFVLGGHHGQSDPGCRGRQCGLGL
jgi:hypothetical protein